MIRIAPSVFAGGTPAHAAAQRHAGRITARFDNATTTPENVRSWLGADYLSAKSANSFSVRRTLRTRSRHEVSNNPYLFGITNNNADDLIDTGPTLQLKTDSPRYNREVEEAWAEWCEEVDLPEKLRVCKVSKTVDGEGFLILKSAASLESPVKLYPLDVEADQVTSVAPKSLQELWIDGLDLDPVTQRPTHYHVMRNHPGDFMLPGLNPFAVDKVQARYVIHWFQKWRPGQVRGVPTFTSSLDLFTELRAFRRAVLTNAQIAASFTALLESQAPADTEEADTEVAPYKKTPINHGMMTTLPRGFKMAGFDPKQPQTTYEMFQEKCLGEAVRPLSYPMNLALGTSQKFNFSSSKLDIMNYRNGLRVERNQCNRVVMNRLFAAWYEEAVLCGAIRAWNGLKVPPREWHWPGFEALDPVADTAADAQRLAAGLVTLQEFWARRGKDWREVLEQQKIEADELSRMGLSFGDVVKRAITQTQDATADDAKPEPANAA